jgi:tetratricopeptide (TPR) repeat protein
MPGEEGDSRSAGRTVVVERATEALDEPSGTDTVPSARETHALEPGLQLAGRFRILRLVAHGGMGAVYEAQDEVLNVRVALKTLLAPAATSGPVMERFRREILLARQVTHRNVCRLFELYLAPDGAEPTAFLTMEFLEGETLSERLARTGPMTEVAAIPLVRQMVTALQAAHEAGVTHRDFKPGNVMLVGPEPRVVVTDFGIARSVVESAATLTAAEAAMLGTPAYMAPEQVTGQEVTGKADVYALGIVLFELLTGRLPFRADTPLATALQRLEVDPPELCSIQPSVSAGWSQTVRACLERDPERRPELDAVLGGLEGKPPPPPPRRRLRWVLIPVALALGVGALLVPGPLRRHQPVRAGSTLGVLGFKNISGDTKLDWLSTAVSEMLTTELNRGDLRTVPGEQMARVRTELRIPAAETLAPETLQRLHEAVGADAVLVGTYFADDSGALRLDARLQDAADGHLIKSLSENGSRARLVTTVEHLGESLRAAVHASRPEGEAVGTASVLPGDPEAARLYVGALDRSRAYDDLGARGLLQRAVAIEAGFAPAHALLATVSSNLGFEEDAAAEAKKALQSAVTLPDHERLMLQARSLAAAGEPKQAAEKLEQLGARWPSDAEALLLLTRVGTPAQAREAVARLHALGAPISDDPRIDLATAQVQLRSNDAAGAQRTAEAARARGVKLGLTSVSARALEILADAQSAAGDWPAAVRTYDQAAQEYIHGGNAFASASVRMSQVGVLGELGRVPEARRSVQQATETLLSIGATRRAADGTETLLYLAESVGDREAAKHALETGRDLLVRSGTAPDALGLSECHFHFDDLDLDRASSAMERYRRWSIATRGDTSAEAVLMSAALERDRDQTEAFLRDIREALALGGDNTDVVGPAFSEEAFWMLDEGRFRELADLVEQGRWIDETPAALFPRAYAVGFAAQAYLGLGNLEAARRALSSAADISSRIQIPSTAAWRVLEVARAQMSLAEGRARDARERMERLLGETSVWPTGSRVEAELARGRILVKAGDVTEGRRVLRALAARADANGWIRVSRLARDAQRR